MLKNTKCIVSLIVVIIFMMIFQAVETKAAPGDYDPSFGIGGSTEFQFDGLKIINRIAIQKDGKILVAGYAVFNQTYRLVLRRHNSDGSLDTSFGVNGEAVERILPGFKYIQLTSPSEIALQSDGSILVGGRRADDNGSFLGNSVWRFGNSGYLDKTFDGIGRKDLSGTATPISVKMMTDGNNNSKILILTTDHPNLTSGGPFSFLARLNLTGSYDTSFGNAGTIKISGGYYDIATYKPNLSLSGESIYVAGSENRNNLTALRFRADGSPDTAFGNFGKITLTVNYEINHSFKKVVVQPDGKVLLAGTFENPTIRYRDFVVRVNNHGVFDQQFGTSTISGNIGAIFNPNAYDATNRDMGLQSDGKIIVGRSSSTFSYKRYLPDGTEDFGYVQPTDSNFARFALQKNNRLVAIEGNWVGGIGYVSYTLRRLLAD